MSPFYLTIQKVDEANDSYLNRHDICFEEMKNRQVTFEEVRAYVRLRQSALSQEEKKRVILDCRGKLSYEDVRNSIRLLGSRFFQDLQGQQKIRTKVYDVNTVHEESSTEQNPGGSSQMEGETILFSQEMAEANVFQALLEQGYEDATFLAAFEDQMITALQESEEISSCFSAYQEARARLRDKAKSRGFWLPKSFQKGNRSGKKGGKGGGHKRSLAWRVANSTCRICDKPGHWKYECPERRKKEETIAMTESVVAGDLAELPEILEPEMIDWEVTCADLMVDFMKLIVFLLMSCCQIIYRKSAEFLFQSPWTTAAWGEHWECFTWDVGDWNPKNVLNRLLECCRKHHRLDQPDVRAMPPQPKG